MNTQAYHVHGQLLRDGNLVTGWCWSPARPRDRLRVTLLIDGTAAGSTVAARLRLDIVRDGLCDGYHGFKLTLPPTLSPASLIEIQEMGTGAVFGRLLGQKMADTEEWARKLDKLTEQLMPMLNNDLRGATVCGGCDGEGF
jgi:hypothetical protein